MSAVLEEAVEYLLDNHDRWGGLKGLVGPAGHACVFLEGFDQLGPHSKCIGCGDMPFKVQLVWPIKRRTT